VALYVRGATNTKKENKKERARDAERNHGRQTEREREREINYRGAFYDTRA